MPAQMTGPIPGENYTSDTKNYPWHRPPEITDLDQAIDVISAKLMDEEASAGIVTMLQTGATIAEITDMFLTSGIGAGKWTPDFALLLAGPTSHILYLMAKGYGIKCELGIDAPKNTMTKSFFEGMKVEEDKVKEIEAMITPDLVQEVSQQATGFMAGLPQGTSPDVTTEGAI